METALGCGYSIHDESLLTDFYSPPTSIIDEEEELFYPEDEEIPSANSDLQSISQTDLRDQLKPLPLKLMSIGTTTTPPTTPRNFLDPLQSTIMDFQKMKILPDLSLTNSFQPPTPTNLFPSTITTTTTTSIDRHSFLEPHGIYASPSELPNNNHSERSRLHSYLNPMDDSMMMMMKSSSLSRPVQSLFPFTNNSLQDPWLLSEIVRQNSQQISLSSTAQQILNGNNRPLRSEKIDIEVIKHLIREANWKRQCGMKKEICVFCRNNGENELIYSSHSLKDPMGNVTCPILRAYQCPICGATGSQAHTIKYCQATGGDDHHHRQLPTPYEKMLRMQTFDFDEQFQSSLLGQFSNPSSLYSNGWSDSYL